MFNPILKGIRGEFDYILKRLVVFPYKRVNKDEVGVEKKYLDQSKQIKIYGEMKIDKPIGENFYMHGFSIEFY